MDSVRPFEPFRPVTATEKDRNGTGVTVQRVLKSHTRHRSPSQWALPVLLAVCLVWFSWRPHPPPPLADPSRKSNGYTDIVTWDNYTLWLHDQRIFLLSGEFHTFRLPVPELWLDIFQKMVAAGLNSVSVYIHMGLSNPSRGLFDFDDWRAIKPIFDAAQLAGLFVIFRPGPYINAETTAGGLSLWLTSEVAGTVRTNATDWNTAYQPYVDAIAKQVVPYQITNGGPVIGIQIDNEIDETPLHRAYFQQVIEQYRQADVVVPLTYNDPDQWEGFINGTGAVDLYGLDAYPQRFDCSNPKVWNPVTTTYHQYHQRVNPSQPWYSPEFQGGAYDPWGGPGYDACAVLTGPEFEDVFYKNNWAANMKLVSYYMLYGGTNWGGLAFPGVYTSYDYGAAIRETRLLSAKYDELKRQGLFIRSSPEFRKTNWLGDTSTGISDVLLSNSAAFVTYLKNPDSGTGFFITRQTDSKSMDNITFTITVPTSKGAITLPATTATIALNGRQSKVIITDYHFGAHGSLFYTTASIFFAGTIGSRDVLFLYGTSDQSHEFAFTPSGHGTGTTSPNVRLRHSVTEGPTPTTVTILPGVTDLVTIWESTTQLVLWADSATAASFWAPAVRDKTPHTREGFENFWQFGTNTTVLVGGPYLVRNASISEGVLALRGDLRESVMLTVFASGHVFTVTWNGEPVEMLRTGLTDTALVGKVAVSADLRSVSVPPLEGWKYADSLPEILPGYDDSGWVIANKTSTNLNVKPLFGDGRVLYGCDYGFCENIVLYRGHFNATNLETAVNLTIYGGKFSASSVWINDKFIDTVYSMEEFANRLFTFPNGSAIKDKDNVITIILDNMGLEMEPNEKGARGIAGFDLVGGNFTTWKIQGKYGGYASYPDKVRGLLNEGGLYGERQGWHLPGFDTSSWTSRDLSEGLPAGNAGVGFFVTTFELAFSKNMDISVSFQFEEFNDQPYRALLFVNGWQFGKRVANVGPQTRFPVPQGILNYYGNNTVAVALWTLDDIPVSPNLQLAIDSVLHGGVGSITFNAPPWEVRD